MINEKRNVTDAGEKETTNDANKMVHSVGMRDFIAVVKCSREDSIRTSFLPANHQLNISFHKSMLFKN